MLNPKIDSLLSKTDNRFTLVMLAAKRARQINSVFNAVRLEEPVETRPPLVKSSSSNPLTMAFEEISKDKITYERVIDGVK
ncbi:MAG: DNA-directed RNA polymerase subunit omega [Terriglobia bacterium]